MFTEGTWVVGKSYDNGLPCVDAISQDGTVTELCVVWGTATDRVANDEARANARLFAASEEMYLTLKDALPGMCYLLELNGDPAEADGWRPWIERAKTLIREIEGGQR